MVAGATAQKLPRAFQNLFVSNLATNLGDGVIRTAAPLLAIRLTTDPLLISLLAALSLLPWLFFAIPSGILVDRIDRRVALRIANGVRVVLASGLVVLYATHTLSVWWLFLVVFIDGTCETLYDGSIRAMLPSLVARPLLPSANSRIEAGELVLQQFVAAPLTSLLFAVAVLIPLGANIGFYAIAVVLALLLPRAGVGAPVHGRRRRPAAAVVPAVRRRVSLHHGQPDAAHALVLRDLHRHQLLGGDREFRLVPGRSRPACRPRSTACSC